LRKLTITITYGDSFKSGLSVATLLRNLASYIGSGSKAFIHDMPRQGPGKASYLRLDGGREDITFEVLPNNDSGLLPAE
jgi:hypothetical protein